MTDYELFTLYKKSGMSKAEAAKSLADQYDLSVDSVRGRLSRADTVENNLRYLSDLLYDDKADPSVERQRAVLNRVPTKTWDTGLFVSDLHIPYLRWDAYELMVQLVQALQPEMITAQNDFRDNAALSRWEDDRTLRGKLWSSDEQRTRSFEETHYRTLRLAAPKADLVQLLGNHDAWQYSFARRTNPESAEMYVADYMEFLEDCGVMQYTDGRRENVIRVNNTVLWHGQFASKNYHSNAKSTLSQFMVDGRAFSTVVGHTHRPTTIHGAEVGYPGVIYVNNGCLCRTENVPYLKRDPRGWGLGVTFVDFKHNHPTFIPFVEDNHSLSAEFRGVYYTTTLDKTSKAW